MLFDSWSKLFRVILVGTLAYAVLVLLLRVSGKRTLAKLNPFDLLVALSSMSATALLNRSVALVESLVAFFLLVGLQYLVAFLSVRFPRFESLAKSEPTLLLYQGRFLNRHARPARDARRDGARPAASGLARPENAAAVVLKSDGALSVVPAAAAAGRSAEVLQGVCRSSREA